MKRVLLADDQQEIRELVARSVELFGMPWRLELAECGVSALEAYHAARDAGEPYSVLVLDIAMPGLSGNEVAKAVRAAGDTQTPIIMFTAFDNVSNHFAAEDVGAFAYINKPMSPALLLDCISRALEA